MVFRRHARFRRFDHCVGSARPAFWGHQVLADRQANITYVDIISQRDKVAQITSEFSV
jgi:hypothetical protein